MNYTTNYQLNKPERNEQFNIDHWNVNSDIIDTQMHTNEVNIATNASSISSILTNLTTNKSSDSSSTYFKLMKLIYPVGSIYWSGNNKNPSTLFGGTWVQIKDKFIWAKGDSDTLGATGGAKTVTLTVNNMPSHNHSFTPGGSISITTNPSFTGTEVTSGANNRGHTHEYAHTHGYTPSGKIASTSGGTDNKTTGMSANNNVYFYSYNKSGDVRAPLTDVWVSSSNPTVSYSETHKYHHYGQGIKVNTSNAEKTDEDSIAGNYDFHGGFKYDLSLSHTHTAYFTGTAGTTASQSTTTSGGESQNHTHSVTASGTISGGAYSFTGTAGTTGSKGSGTAVNIMPPYVVKYCWERTA